MRIGRLALVAVLLVLGCSREPEPKRYQLQGQILAIKPETQEVLVKHQDIPGFMMAMTMPYKVEDAALLDGKAAGDLITATLVVGETRAYLSAVTKTGHAELEAPPAQPEVSVFDLLKPGDSLPDVALIDQDGTSFQLASYKGRPFALTFIYTRCPDPEFCPLMNQHFLEVQKQLAASPALADARLLSISFDPTFDAPTVMKAAAARAQANPARWRFATGTADDITRFAGRFGVTVTSNGTPILIHNLGTAVFDRQGRLVALHSNNRWTPADLLAELHTASTATH